MLVLEEWGREMKAKGFTVCVCVVRFRFRTQTIIRHMLS